MLSGTCLRETISRRPVIRLNSPSGFTQPGVGLPSALEHRRLRIRSAMTRSTLRKKDIQVGDLVLCRKENRKNKLQPRYSPPARVIQLKRPNAVLLDLASEKTFRVHLDRLKKFFEPSLLPLRLKDRGAVIFDHSRNENTDGDNDLEDGDDDHEDDVLSTPTARSQDPQDLLQPSPRSPRRSTVQRPQSPFLRVAPRIHRIRPPRRFRISRLNQSTVSVGSPGQ
ncbi:hypothetical protein L596_005733 [Steinernema carpocapsae]|uniref:Uncharacterized protein n=1 Tax=Steinernema carpocapsae TaxID=34508 RepID=A0A4V6I8R1_STECR|nr:hypothetical protein L596_005733 [Steinernema carpocapsae]